MVRAVSRVVHGCVAADLPWLGGGDRRDDAESEQEDGKHGWRELVAIDLYQPQHKYVTADMWSLECRLDTFQLPGRSKVTSDHSRSFSGLIRD